MDRLTRGLVGISMALGLLGCSGDDGGKASSSFGSATQTNGTSPATTMVDSSGGEASTGGADSTGVAPTTTGQPGTSSSSGEASTGSGNMCNPVVPGEWNACHDENGQVDNTQCNWTGAGGATGFIGCLTSSQTQGANVCFIEGCRDVCDCFAPPATGNAEVVCSDILEGGGMGCALSCANGETCPDGMTCEGTICFWPPA